MEEDDKLKSTMADLKARASEAEKKNYKLRESLKKAQSTLDDTNKAK